MALAALATAVVVTTSLPAPDRAEAAGPPACPFSNTSQRYCNRDTTERTRGSIGLLGDSVLLGSANGASNPGLPTMLANNGYGPINLVATLGMKTRWSADNNVSAYYWIDRWKANGFSPQTIVLNLGANHLGTCNNSNPAPCKAKIDELLNRIATNFPTAVIWWPKIVHRISGVNTTSMLGWNAALDQARAERPNLLVWDWPSALDSANPPIVMDLFDIHPVSGTQYVKRSTLMATHITDYAGGARFLGPRVTPPSADTENLGYLPHSPEQLYRTPTDGARFTATETRDIDLSAIAAVDEFAKALALTVTALNPAASGHLIVWRCGDTKPSTSNVNFTAGVQRTAQVVTRLTDSGHICVFTSAATDVIISIQGNFVIEAGTRLNPITPVRPLDTRNTGRAQDLELTVPGTDVLAAAVTISTNGASSGGSVTIYDCAASIPDVANLSYQPSETVASAAFVQVSGDSTLCVHITAPDTVYPDVIVDVTGVFLADAGLYFRPVSATRLLDTRNFTGGWLGRHGARQSIDVVAGPVGAKAVTGTITIVKPMFKAFLNAYACGLAPPTTSSVNAKAGLVLANSITVGVNATERTLCIFSSQNTNTLFDAVGWWVEAT